MKLREGSHYGLLAVPFLYKNPVGKKQSYQDWLDYAHPLEV
jgi:hypothetical protein